MVQVDFINHDDNDNICSTWYCVVAKNRASALNEAITAFHKQITDNNHNYEIIAVVIDEDKGE